jgi:hypothetical protein
VILCILLRKWKVWPKWMNWWKLGIWEEMKEFDLKMNEWREENLTLKRPVLQLRLRVPPQSRNRTAEIWDERRISIGNGSTRLEIGALRALKMRDLSSGHSGKKLNFHVGSFKINPSYSSS